MKDRCKEARVNVRLYYICKNCTNDVSSKKDPIPIDTISAQLIYLPLKQCHVDTKTKPSLRAFLSRFDFCKKKNAPVFVEFKIPFEQGDFFTEFTFVWPSKDAIVHIYND